MPGVAAAGRSAKQNQLDHRATAQRQRGARGGQLMHAMRVGGGGRLRGGGVTDKPINTNTSCDSDSDDGVGSPAQPRASETRGAVASDQAGEKANGGSTGLRALGVRN